jgi:hypothetical protein
MKGRSSLPASREISLRPRDPAFARRFDGGGDPPKFSSTTGSIHPNSVELSELLDRYQAHGLLLAQATQGQANLSLARPEPDREHSA